MVADRAVHRDWNWEMECLSWLLVMLLLVNRPPMVFFHMWPKRRNWKNFVSSVISTPVPMSRTSAGTPHTTPLMASLTEETVCVMLSMVHDPFSKKIKKKSLPKQSSLKPTQQNDSDCRKNRFLCPFA